MKDQYVGDVNDYLKYALLRGLTLADGNTMVVWMRTAGDGRGDGGRIGYLSQERFRAVDPPLFDDLARLVADDRRSLMAVRKAGVLPRASYWEDELSDNDRARREYFRSAFEAATEFDFIFFDPDNGLEIASVARGRKGSCKYLYRDELATAFGSGSSVVFYQHFPRRARMPYLRQMADVLLTEIQCPVVLVLMSSHVAYVVLPHAEVRSRVESAIRDVTSRAMAIGAAFAEFA
ncbi:MAG TPA: hypothetical protein VMU74_02365 [Gaiellaceae bacterium]|nr:hypothetical protein [Gaiellaceae bacterium]